MKTQKKSIYRVSTKCQHSIYTVSTQYLPTTYTQVLIYAGDVDYICNWLGNKKWVKALEWSGKEEFNMAEDEPWTLTTGRGS